MNSLSQILKENKTWNLSPIPVYVDNLHHPFFETSKKYILPSVSIYGLTEDSAEKYLNEIKSFLPIEIKNFSTLRLNFFKRETSKLIFGLELNLDFGLFLYLIKFECKHLGGVNFQELISPPTQEKSASCYTNKIYYSQSIIPIQRIYKKENQIEEFEVLQFSKSIFEKKLHSQKHKFISELFDEVDYSHLIQEIERELELSQYWKLGKIFSPLKIEYFTLGIQFLNLNISENIKWLQKFFPLLINILEQKPISLEHKKTFWEWLGTHSSERILTNSKNLAWKIEFQE